MVQYQSSEREGSSNGLTSVWGGGVTKSVERCNGSFCAQPVLKHGHCYGGDLEKQHQSLHVLCQSHTQVRAWATHSQLLQPAARRKAKCTQNSLNSPHIQTMECCSKEREEAGQLLRLPPSDSSDNEHSSTSRLLLS